MALSIFESEKHIVVSLTAQPSSKQFQGSAYRKPKKHKYMGEAIRPKWF